MRSLVTQSSLLLTPLALTALALPALLVAQDDRVREIDALTLQWTELEHQRDTLLANWRTDRPILEQQLSLLERETRELTELIETSAREQDDVEQRRLELLEEQTRLEQEQAALESSLARAARELRSLHTQLPPPLVDAWAADLRRLDDPLMTATERLQLVIELLQQLDDFEQRVTLHEAVMTLDDGRDHLVTQVYLGLSHGWYVTDDRRFAAAGVAGPAGWQWTPVSEGAAIADIVGILERRLEPDLVSIPLTLSAEPVAGGD